MPVAGTVTCQPNPLCLKQQVQVRETTDAVTQVVDTCTVRIHKCSHTHMFLLQRTALANTGKLQCARTRYYITGHKEWVTPQLAPKHQARDSARPCRPGLEPPRTPQNPATAPTAQDRSQRPHMQAHAPTANSGPREGNPYRVPGQAGPPTAPAQAQASQPRLTKTGTGPTRSHAIGPPAPQEDTPCNVYGIYKGKPGHALGPGAAHSDSGYYPPFSDTPTATHSGSRAQGTTCRSKRVHARHNVNVRARSTLHARTKTEDTKGASLRDLNQATCKHERKRLT